MTKKSKEEELSMTKHNEQQNINTSTQSTGNNLLSPPKQSNNKKFIKKPQPQTLIQKIDSLKQKNHKLYKHAQKKIDRMIEIIDEISEKQLGLECHGKSDGGGGEVKRVDEVGQGKISAIGQQQTATITKTLTHLHNLLTYQKPLSHIRKQFQSFYSKLSTFSKDLQTQSTLPDDKKFLIPQDGLIFQQAKLVEQLIKQHYLRIGWFGVAGMFGNDGEGRKDGWEVDGQEYDDSGKLGMMGKRSKSSVVKSSSGVSKQKAQKKHATKRRQKSATKKPPKAQLIDLQQNFQQCFTLRTHLLQGNFQQPIIWCQQQRLYETHSNPLQYELRLTQIKLLIRDGKHNAAYAKIEGHMGRFLDNYQQQINLLVGYLMFSCGWDSNKIFASKKDVDVTKSKVQEQQQQQQVLFGELIKQRYSRFIISQGELQGLALRFMHEYFIHYDISQFDTLEICYKVGKRYQQQYFQAIKMFSQRDKHQFLKHRIHCQLTDSKTNRTPHPVILPFEIPVDKQYLYHSIFVCPVTKAVLSSNDGVEFLSCGHLVSQSAKKDMAEVRRSNHKHKCPVCQKDRTGDVVKVSF